MDKAIQENTELRDEELYALLDKAWETDDRLCVSEELIQKTLKRAAEETDSKVIPFETAAKRKLSPMKYVGVAAAAVFVAVLGVNAFGNGGFLENNIKIEATADNASRKSDGAEYYESSQANTAKVNSENAADGWWYSESENAHDLLADAQETLEPRRPGAEIREEAVAMSGMTLTLPQELSAALIDTGNVPVSDTVECWEFATGEKEWETELLNRIKDGASFGNGLPHSGTYEYVLECIDGTQKKLEYHEPLDLIVRIETKQGTLWGLMGDDCFWVLE